MIGPIQGRTQALVHCANGRWLPGTFFAHFFKDFSHAIRHYQIEQRTRGAFTIRIVPGDFWSVVNRDTILTALRPHIGSSVVEIELVDRIPLLETGKRTPVVSSILVDFQNL
jgi:phenylacetate-CoA ligase